MSYAKEKIDTFLGRKMRDLELVKGIPIQDIDRELAQVGFSPPCELWEHQRRCCFLATRCPGLILLLSCGMGKTRTAASIFDWHLSRGNADRCLVVTPFATVVGEWRREMKNFPAINFVGLDGTSSENKERWEDTTPNMVGCTVAMFLQRVGAAKNSKVDKAAALEKLVEDYDMVIFDESSYLRKSDTVIFKTLRDVMEAMPYKLFLTGTPMNGDPQDLWPQFRLADGGYTLGESITLFRQTYFTEERTKFGRGRMRVDYKFKNKYHSHLHERIRNSSIRYDASEHGEMPDMLGGLYSRQFITRTSLMPESTKAQYSKMLDEIRAASGDQEQIENAYLGMRKMAAGYMTVGDDDILFKDNPKLRMLSDEIAKVPEGDKTLIGCWYKTTAKMVYDHLRKAGAKVAKIDGETHAQVRQEIIHEFRNTDNIDILIGTLAIGYGTNLPEAKRIIFYESPDSQIDREQFERRVLRGDSKHSPTCIELVIAHSVDEWILENLLKKDKMNARILKGKVLDMDEEIL